MQPPIADPNETAPRHFAGEDMKEFRLKLWPYFLSTWLATVVTAFGVIFLPPLLTVGSRALPSGQRSLFMLVVSAVLILAMCAYIWRGMPLKVARWGLRSVTFWTTPQEVAWSQMTSVRTIWMGVPYAVVTCRNRPKLWVWLALDEPRQFAAAVATHTAPDHPLHAFLAARGLIENPPRTGVSQTNDSAQ